MRDHKRRQRLPCVHLKYHASAFPRLPQFFQSVDPKNKFLNFYNTRKKINIKQAVIISYQFGMINFRDVLPVITHDKFVINKCCKDGTIQSNEIKIGDDFFLQGPIL